MRTQVSLTLCLGFAYVQAVPASGNASAPPTNVNDLATRLAAVYKANPSNPPAVAAAILQNGLAGNPPQVPGIYGPCNVGPNVNPKPPASPVYPKSPSDAPYDVSENDLRSAIYIPPGFTYGQKPPVLFIPGTGVEACQNFQPNFGKLFMNVPYADPVYVNVPNNMLMDIQTNAEYVAYATNYISGISNNANVSTLTWSQGSIASQWAYKYWPSTRKVTSDMFCVSADFHGTVLEPILCPPGDPCAPSVLQQNYPSKFIATLRNNGGDSAYVPTTQIHSVLDEIVEPQQDPFASSQINDARAVGVSNNQLQNICPFTSPAGFVNFGHESLLYNAIAFDLARDALSNPGPANLARSGASGDCGMALAPGLNIVDALATESLIPTAGFNIEAYNMKVTQEPPIKPYAAHDVPPGYSN